jgi:hypothetical protein
MALAGLVALPAAAQDQPKPKPLPGKLQLQVRPAVIGGAFALRGPKLNLTDDRRNRWLTSARNAARHFVNCTRTRT